MRSVHSLMLLLLAHATAYAQVRFVEPDRKTGTSAAVIVPENTPLLHTTQIAGTKAAAVVQELKTLLGEQKLALKDVVKLNLAAATPAALAELEAAVASAWKDLDGPAVCTVITELPSNNVVAVDAVATLPAGGMARGPHAGVLAPGKRIWIAGQAEGGELLEATRKTMESLDKTLRFLERSKADVVQVKAFINPMTRAEDVRKEIARFFGDQPLPPLVFIDWKFATPIEIELIAHGGAKSAGDPVDYLTPPFMTSSPVFSRVTRINLGPVIYISGLHASKANDADGEITQIFERLGGILKASGSDFKHLVKATYYCTQQETIKRFGQMRPKYYDPKRPPSASLSKVVGTGREGNTITIDMIAVPASISRKDP